MEKIMPKLPKVNIELIEEKFKNVHKRIDDADAAVADLEQTVKKEYTPLSSHNELKRTVGKFENFWDWGLKIVLGAIILGIIALLGLGGQR